MLTCIRTKIDHYLSPCRKLKSRCFKDLNINPDTLKLIEEKVGIILEYIGIRNQHLNIKQ